MSTESNAHRNDSKVRTNNNSIWIITIISPFSINPRIPTQEISPILLPQFNVDVYSHLINGVSEKSQWKYNVAFEMVAVH